MSDGCEYRFCGEGEGIQAVDLFADEQGDEDKAQGVTDEDPPGGDLLPLMGFGSTHGFTDIVAALPSSFFSMGSYGVAATLGFFSWIIPQAFLSQELWVRIFACKDEKLAVPIRPASRMPWITGLPNREIRVGRTASPTSPGMRVAAIRPTETTSASWAWCWRCSPRTSSR